MSDLEAPKSSSRTSDNSHDDGHKRPRGAVRRSPGVYRKLSAPKSQHHLPLVNRTIGAILIGVVVSLIALGFEYGLLQPIVDGSGQEPIDRDSTRDEPARVKPGNDPSQQEAPDSSDGKVSDHQDEKPTNYGENEILGPEESEVSDVEENRTPDLEGRHVLGSQDSQSPILVRWVRLTLAVPAGFQHATVKVNGSSARVLDRLPSFIDIEVPDVDEPVVVRLEGKLGVCEKEVLATSDSPEVSICSEGY